MNRPQQLLLATALAACIGTPLAAQELSESYRFLKAVRERDGTKVEQIVNNPASSAINARDNDGQAALHIVAQRRDIAWLDFLLAHGARPDIQAGDGSTPLGIAAQIGWLEGAEKLLARGATVDLANNRGETPLILAVQTRQMPMVQLLLRSGADPSRQDSFTGNSALDYARRDTRNPELLRILETERRQQRPAVIGPSPN